jgi:predicted RNA-binding protein associated with RNAse of E/G family
MAIRYGQVTPMINPMNAYNRMGPTEATTAYGKRPNRKIIKKGKAFKKNN